MSIVNLEFYSTVILTTKFI